VYKVCSEHLEPGMVLGKNLTGADGGVLLAAGVVLDEAGLSALREAEIPFAYVKFEAEAPDPDFLGRVSVAHARRFFLYVDADNPGMEALFRVSANRTFDALNAGAWQIPCADEMTARNVEHLSDLFPPGQGSPQDIVTRETELASFPDVAFRIKEVLDSPTASAQDIAKVVERDMALTAKLLKLVNSPFYGLSAPVDSVSRAVSIIGIKELSTLALGISAINFFQGIPAELMDMKTFWAHSLSCAVFSKLIAAKIPGLAAERMFTAGLLHDAGRLIMFKNLPYACTEALLYARGNLTPLVAAEQRVLGYDHGEVGRQLLAAWKFPVSLADPIAHHHEPGLAEEPLAAAVVQLADNLANAASITAGGMYVLPGMESATFASLGLDPGDLAPMFPVHDQSLGELGAVFLR
jgi:HD-like signal output (HDOD) protein